MKTFLYGMGTAGFLALAGFLFVSIGMPVLFPPKVPVDVSVPATPSPEVKRMPKKKVAVQAPVEVYDDKAKFKLKLPESVQIDPDSHVVAATQVRGSDRPQTITTVIDEKTGQSQTFVKQDPYPWLAIENRAEVRMSYGYRSTPGAGNLALPSSIKQVGRLSFTYDAVRIKALTAGVQAQIDTDGQAFVGAGVAYRW